MELAAWLRLADRLVGGKARPYKRAKLEFSELQPLLARLSL
ncbi:hypothetical protein [Paraburkholderia sp. J67]|nr:hypothetical protein [Paraburkholderia sp. J67]